MENNNQYEEIKKNSELMETPEAAMAIRTANFLEKTILKKEENAKVPETVFKEYFLDFFRNYNKDTEPTDSDNALYAKWLELAGSEYNEVDVINDKGETVFTTPALLTVPTIDYKKALDMGINQTAVEALQNRNRTPAESINYVNSQVSRFMAGAVSVDTRDETARWEKILKKYKSTEEVEQENIKKTLKKMPDVVKEDLGLIYD